MATVKVKLRISKTNPNEGVIYYQLYHCKQTLHITTKTRLSISDFESIKRAKTLQEIEYPLRQIKSKIDYDTHILHTIIRDFETLLMSYTVSDIKRHYVERKSNVYFVSYMNDIIVKLKHAKKFGTAQNYLCTLRSFTTFLNNKDIELSLINASLITDYNEWLEAKNITKNTISFYMRNLRSVYNRAVKQSLTKQTFPFTSVYTGVDKTRKLAISEEDLYKIVQFNVCQHTDLELTRNLFLFSYTTRGMAFVDMAFLKKENIVNNMIVYRRKKTGQLLSIKIEPCIRCILDKYLKCSAKTDYVFPIIKASDSATVYKQYHIALTNYNRKLKRLAKMAQLNIKLSSYSARHTWATIAHYHNVPLPVISEGMGHTSESTTQIYLASLHHSVVDQANSRLLERLNLLISF